MPGRSWYAERAGENLTVWRHHAMPRVRIQLGPHINERGDLMPHGVNIARLINGEWDVDKSDPTFFFVADARDYLDSVGD